MPRPPLNRHAFPVQDYDLAVTLESGQAFRWRRHARGWTGVVRGRWVCLRQSPDAILVETREPQADWEWLAAYLQIHVDLGAILKTFPSDEPMRAALRACRGLRLLRQDPWECLASFILSSTKQIVQIQQIVAELCRRRGASIPAPSEEPPAFAFPTVENIASATEADLRSCKMGFRAPYLLSTARMIAGGQFDLDRLRSMGQEEARAELARLRGVGPKIADCVLLFAYGFPAAFPLDVWVTRALRRLYFGGRPVKKSRLLAFPAKYFGPNAGYAQQYLFHHARSSSSITKAQRGETQPKKEIQKGGKNITQRREDAARRTATKG